MPRNILDQRIMHPETWVDRMNRRLANIDPHMPPIEARAAFLGESLFNYLKDLVGSNHKSFYTRFMQLVRNQVKIKCFNPSPVRKFVFDDAT